MWTQGTVMTGECEAARNRTQMQTGKANFSDLLIIESLQAGPGRQAGKHVGNYRFRYKYGYGGSD